MSLRHAASRNTLGLLRVSALVLALAIAVGCTSYRAAGLYRSGTQALNAGETDVALAQLREAARLMPEVSEIRNHLGLAYAAKGRHAEALVAFERAVELDCTNDAAAENLAAARHFAATHPRSPAHPAQPSLRDATGTK